MPGSDKYFGSSINHDCVAGRPWKAKAVWYRSLWWMRDHDIVGYSWKKLKKIKKIPYHVCVLPRTFDHESNCINGSYLHIVGLRLCFCHIYSAFKIFRCIPRKHTALALARTTPASHSVFWSCSTSPLHQHLLNICAIVVVQNIKCLALRQHQYQEESVQMQMVMIPTPEIIF